eukprot:snap_masked-scaffold_14-processed-gene-3.50-mRNA-1 protein AED:1.00 eAED:1.00 QI:0/0/0/0/1/1/2/0/62
MHICCEENKLDSQECPEASLSSVLTLSSVLAAMTTLLNINTGDTKESCIVYQEYKFDIICSD